MQIYIFPKMASIEGFGYDVTGGGWGGCIHFISLRVMNETNFSSKNRTDINNERAWEKEIPLIDNNTRIYWLEKRE